MYPFRPYEGHQLAYYQMGFAKGFAADASTVDPSVGVPNDSLDVYNEGLSDGALYATDGFPIEPECYDLSHDHTAPQVILHSIDFAIEGWGVIHAYKMVGAIAASFEGAVLLLMLSISLQSEFDDPDKILSVSDFATFSDALATVGEPVSIELFFGGGVDFDQAGCELKMTRVYKTLDEARSALSALNRPTGFIASIRTDMSGFQFVEKIG